MSEDPALILQSGRLGDLIMTFPLVLDLQRQNPARPVWVVSGEEFFQPLISLAPNAVFFPASHLPELGRLNFSLLINLGSNPTYTNFAGKCNAPERLGVYAQAGVRRVNGFWHLYRSSLTNNNRHNSFHWADLFRLDTFRGPRWAMGTQRSARNNSSGRIGLVLGASERAKRPDAFFWSRLARRLAMLGLKPIFLGGPGDVDLGREVGRLSGLQNANFCGRLNLSETAALMRGLDLLVSPDTGPMHLADWLGVPVLNLSLGPVNSRETGPIAQGQWVLRPRISCEGCWACHHGRFKCHAHFNPRLIAELVARLAEDPQNPQLSILPMPDLDLLRSGRDGRGLYNLEPFNLEEATATASARSLLDNFWREYFLHISGKFEDALPKAGHELTRLYPNLTAGLRDELSHIIGDYRKTLRASQILSSEHWQGASAGVRLFAGFAQMRLQNDDFSHQAWERSIRELLIAHTALDPAC